MNFYKHHLGDYDGATAHLSWAEDMAYTRLMRVYYRREQPIPDAEKYRLVRASSKDQRAAVDTVLGEFFELRSGLWHQKRCDEEIEAYREEATESDAKRENERERQKRYRERRRQLFAELRQHGIVPKWDTSLDDLETELSRVRKRDSNGDSHAPVTRTDTANQNPVPRIGTTPPLPLSGAFAHFWEAWPVGPRKRGREKCAEIWRKKGLDSAETEILDHVRWMKRSEDWRKGFVPAPEVYLRNGHWQGAELREPERERSFPI